MPKRPPVKSRSWASPEPSTPHWAQSGPERRSAIEAQIDAINATLDPHEHLTFGVVVKDSWTIENGMLTPTMKIKRNVIEDRYAAQVVGWYALNQRVVWELMDRRFPLP